MFGIDAILGLFALGTLSLSVAFFALLLLFLLLFFLPSIIALRVAHPHKILIILTNTLGGWFSPIIGWPLALLWALLPIKNKYSPPKGSKFQAAQPSNEVSPDYAPTGDAPMTDIPENTQILPVDAPLPPTQEAGFAPEDTKKMTPAVIAELREFLATDGNLPLYELADRIKVWDRLKDEGKLTANEHAYLVHMVLKQAKVQEEEDAI